MRDAGVLINRTGPRETVLKIRPPLVFSEEHAEVLVTALASAKS
jgi:4-aminobutyrate aminotransferase-like enzyme